MNNKAQDFVYSRTNDTIDVWKERISEVTQHDGEGNWYFNETAFIKFGEALMFISNDDGFDVYETVHDMAETRERLGI